MGKYIGKKIDGRYEILELIGVGGMANVYRARDVVENRMVAVKILREEFLENEEFLRRFRNESKAIALLNHPNIVKVYDVSFSEKLPAIVMEYIDGVTLKDYIDQQHVLTWKEAVHFTVQILRALQHAHDRGVVHRDIKPQNIMLLSDGTIKVMDFGIARMSRSEQRTLTQSAIGSVHYISPEQACGGDTDEKTDIYSVGIMLFEMLTGRLPFEADSPVSVALKQIQSQPLLPREINPEIPEALEEITMRAMQKDPAKRYQSAAEMLQDIDEFKKNPSIHFAYQYLAEPQEEEQKRYTSIIDKMNHRFQDKKGGEAVAEKAPLIPVMTGVLVAAVLATILFVVSIITIIKPFSSTQDLPAPELVGQFYTDIQNNSEIMDQFNIKVESTEYNEEYEEGKIFYQNPSPGSKVKEGSVIRIRVSKGPSETAVMPDLAGEEYSVARQALEDMGCTVREETMNSNTVAKGYVIRTNPEEGEAIPEDKIVTIIVSAGPVVTTATMPELKGFSIEEATEILRNMGLLVQTEVVQSEEAQGTVIGQSIAYGSRVTAGNTVILTVSDGSGAEKTFTGQIEHIERYASMNSTDVRISKDSDAFNVSATVDNSNGENIKVDLTMTAPSSETGTYTFRVYTSENQLIATCTINFSNGNFTVDPAETSDEQTVTFRLDLSQYVQEGSTAYVRWNGQNTGINLTDPSRATFTLTGSGQQTVEIYIDNQRRGSCTVDFDSGRVSNVSIQ